MKLIGIGGTDGSGKDTVSHFLANKFGWQFVSVSDILRNELNSRGIPLSRKSLRQFSAEWRRENGLGILVDKAVDAYDNKAPGLVIASLRNFGEADRVHELGGKVIWVDADPKVRYKRIFSRNRGDEDHVSFQEFLAEERDQMEHFNGDEHTLNLAGVKNRADIYIDNDSANLEEFKKKIEKQLKSLLLYYLTS